MTQKGDYIGLIPLLGQIYAPCFPLYNGGYGLCAFWVRRFRLRENSILNSRETLLLFRVI